MSNLTPEPNDPEAYRVELRTAPTEVIAEHYRFCRDNADRLARLAAGWRARQQEAGEAWADRVNFEYAVEQAMAGDAPQEPPC